ncbi:hypothetical protein HK097_007819 [Rhizophlyctis rosea]|uniref:Guanylate cyclase domain-containing protein n=1 Tax=Rhizophlyctis rosea TaxID=64517 RepID=A0AAD5SCP0_9FUNG|nr:hypothetical protein HK097_007819 [Rhizophlyctis rosea]
MTEIARRDNVKAQEDEELIDFLELMRVEDQALAMAIEKERDSVENAIEKMHRLNNFHLDEAHIREANIAEANFLLQMQEMERKWLQQRQVEEAASLKEEEEDRRMLERLIKDMRSLRMGIRQRKEAAEKVQSVKMRISERRQAFATRLSAIEIRQERERKALHDSHSRIVKFDATQNMSIYRQLLQREYEDQELEQTVTTMRGDQKARGIKTASLLDAEKLHEAKMLQLKLRMQKEAEQLREEQLLRLKHMQKVCDLELDHVDDLENLAADQKVQELELELEQKREMEQEEERIQQQNDTFKAFASQRQLQLKAARIATQQRSEARQLARQHKVAAKQRETQFFENEEVIKQNARALDDDDDKRSLGFSEVDGTDALSSAQQSVAATELSDYTDAGTVMNDNTAANKGKAITEVVNTTELQEQQARDTARLEELAKRHADAMEALRTQQREYLASMKREQGEEMSALQQEQEEEYKQLKVQHHIEMDKLLKTQMLADQLEADNEMSNELLYGMLPRYVADAMKEGTEVEPRDFECITILYSDIVQFTNLTAKSRPQQIVSLLNRLYTAFDSILDDYTDVYKTETIGDAYQIVGGLNSTDANYQKYAIEVVDCAFRFIQEVETLDMSDQAQEKLHMRIGIHSGPAVGGVAGITMPKFALFGDNVNIASLMEQKSSPNRVHVSSSTYELVKDAFDFEKRPELVPIEGGEAMTTYWLVGRKQSADADKGGRGKQNAAKRAAAKGVGSKMMRTGAGH